MPFNIFSIPVCFSMCEAIFVKVVWKNIHKIGKSLIGSKLVKLQNKHIFIKQTKYIIHCCILALFNCEVSCPALQLVTKDRAIFCKVKINREWNQTINKLQHFAFSYTYVHTKYIRCIGKVMECWSKTRRIPIVAKFRRKIP